MKLTFKPVLGGLGPPLLASLALVMTLLVIVFLMGAWVL